jgi:hypothetical protein
MTMAADRLKPFGGLAKSKTFGTYLAVQARNVTSGSSVFSLSEDE